MPDIQRFFKRHHIEVNNIISVFSCGRNTMICLRAGEEVSSNIRLRDMLAILPAEDYISISRSVIVRRDAILAISDKGIYTTIDGRTFQGRQRYLSAHKKLRKELGLNVSAGNAEYLQSIPIKTMTFLEKCSVLDNMPIAYCVIELVFDEAGHGVDFIFRYCNNQMAVVEGVPVEEMIDRSFYEIFRNGDRKWLVTYADVALNGVQRTLYDYSPEIDKNLTIYCYQPEPGYCACVLVTDADSSSGK